MTLKITTIGVIMTVCFYFLMNPVNLGATIFKRKIVGLDKTYIEIDKFRLN